MSTLSIGSKEKKDFSILGSTRTLVSLLKVALRAFSSLTDWQNFTDCAVVARGNHKVDRRVLTEERAGRDRRHAPPQRILNNLPLMFTPTKEKLVLADASTNFLRFPQHPVYNSIGRTGTKSKADPRCQKSS